MWTSNRDGERICRETAASVARSCGDRRCCKDISMTSERLQATDASATDKRPRKSEGDRLSKLPRHKHIIAQLTATPTLRASELAAVPCVSAETIRHALLDLQDRKLTNRSDR